MRRVTRLVVLWLAVGSLVVGVLPANARHRRDPHTPNLRPRGHTNDNRPVESFADPFFTDIAFKRKLAYQGTWSGGFRIIDISSARRPRVLSEVECGEFQGDIGVYRKLVFRSIDTPVDAQTPEETCTAPVTDAGFEGIQIFKVDDPENASADDLVTAVGTDCGSHTHTVVPDKIRNRVLLYVSNSGLSPEYEETVFGNECDENHGKFQIISVPLDAPEEARVIRDVKLGPADEDPISLDCHDIGVLKSDGSPKRAVCAGDAAIVYDISRRGGARPRFLNAFTALGVGGWHSAALSWDGRITVMGWEPGGGVGPECEADDRDLEKSVFFFDTATGELLGTWVLPRAQSELENCTIHNYNVVPTLEKNVLVMGNYQAGTWVVDFTNPREPRTVAWSDPAPADPEELTLAGAWGSYWYNGKIYETNITEGVNIFKLLSPLVSTAQTRHFLNPQTQYGPLR